MAINLDKFKEALDNITPEEMEKYFPQKDKGWVSLKDEYPHAYVKDYLKQGYSTFLVKDANGKEFEQNICDGCVWYYSVAVPLKITHWFRDK